MSDVKKVEFARGLIRQMSGNSNFATANPALACLTAAISELETAYNEAQLARRIARTKTQMRKAASVALVGDFNDWDPARSPMQTAHGVWATVVQLAPGRYRYAFLVNGVEWRADPSAPAAKDDEFGTPSSVVTVGGRGS